MQLSSLYCVCTLRKIEGAPVYVKEARHEKRQQCQGCINDLPLSAWVLGSSKQSNGICSLGGVHYQCNLMAQS